MFRKGYVKERDKWNAEIKIKKKVKREKEIGENSMKTGKPSGAGVNKCQGRRADSSKGE
jgi:hypothetical protein